MLSFRMFNYRKQFFLLRPTSEEKRAQIFSRLILKHGYENSRCRLYSVYVRSGNLAISIDNLFNACFWLSLNKDIKQTELDLLVLVFCFTVSGRWLYFSYFR